MGKSLGNAVTIRALLETYPSEALRLYYLQTHYRSPLPFDESALPDALGMLARLYEAREVAEKMGGDGDPDGIARALGADALEVLTLGRAFRAGMDESLREDFNTSRALGLAFELARAVNRLSNHPKSKKLGGPVVAPALEALASLADIGLLTADTATFQAEIKAKRLPMLGITSAQVEELIAARAQARRDKEWAKADAIRDELEARQIAVMDRPDGATEWRVRL
ncbi:MAG: hypothetical protein KC621_01510, partial [Myxococcales bacterium]|nr:hypothetical protein [Myxococcales bacterium]